MDLRRQNLNHKPSFSKSQSVWRGGTLNVISAHDVLVDYCYTTTSGCCYHRINCQQSGLSQTIQLPMCTSLEKVAIIVICIGNNSLNWYCCLWRRMAISLSLTKSAGWNWLLWMFQTNSTDSTRHQSSKLGLCSPVFKAEQLIRYFTELQCVLIINCQPQTVQAAIPDTAWYQILYLQWLSTIGSLPLPPNSFPSNV